MTAVIAVTSGSPQVGKSTLSANLAHYLNENGHRTGLLEAGSRSPLWNIQPKSTWTNILNGRIPLEEAIHRDLFGVDLMVTQGHGHALGGLTAQAADRMAEAIKSLDAYAYLIVDMAAGLNAPAIAGCLAATETLLVITPDTPTLTAAYEWLVRLARHGFSGPVNIVLNRVKKPALAQSVFIRFRDLAQKKLNLQTNLWGSMSQEPRAGESDNQDRPLSLTLPYSKLVRDIRIISDRLKAELPPENQTQPLNIFWRQFIDQLRSLPVMPVTPQEREESSVKKDKADAPAPPTPHLPPFDPAAAMQNLTEQLAAIAKELAGIRRLLEAQSSPTDAATPHGETHTADSTKLDFDAFVASELKSK